MRTEWRLPYLFYCFPLTSMDFMVRDFWGLTCSKGMSACHKWLIDFTLCYRLLLYKCLFVFFTPHERYCEPDAIESPSPIVQLDIICIGHSCILYSLSHLSNSYNLTSNLFSFSVQIQGRTTGKMLIQCINIVHKHNAWLNCLCDIGRNVFYDTKGTYWSSSFHIVSYKTHQGKESHWKRETGTCPHVWGDLITYKHLKERRTLPCGEDGND